jgi:electron transport complex protein RnfD
MTEQEDKKDIAPEKLIVSSSPHAHSGSTVRGIMLDVIIAMAPAMVAAVFFFGMDALRLIGVCVATCVLTEVACRRLMNRDKGIGDLSAVVTGLLLAFNLPPSLPTWMAVVGCVIAIGIAKQVFGGIGYNPFNPALVGRVALLISFPVAMTTWSEWIIPAPAGINAVSTATPLGLLKTSLVAGKGMPFDFDPQTAMQFFMGNMNGCIGEVSAFALILGAVYLLWRRCISWHIPTFYIGTVAICALILKVVAPETNMPVSFHLLSGGLMLGALFMATDMVTSPITKGGMAVFGIGCGVLTIVIRKWGGYPEGVSFAILIMNSITPLINRFTRPRIFGFRKKS